MLCCDAARRCRVSAGNESGLCIHLPRPEHHNDGCIGRQENPVLSIHRALVSLGLLVAIVIPGERPLAQDPERILSTGVTGMITSRGLDNPRYVLTREPVQRLILEITDNPISPDAARLRLSGGIHSELGGSACHDRAGLSCRGADLAQRRSLHHSLQRIRP